MSESAKLPGPVPVVHIGMPKTATKTLQWRLFAGHSQIFYLGRFDGPQFRKAYRQFEACRDEQVLQIMQQIAYRGIHSPDIAQCRAWLEAYLRSHNPEAKLPVWSWESYSTDSFANRQRRAQNLRELFGEARILVTIRHPVKLLESAFLQQLKRDNIGARARRGKPVYFEDIDMWMARDAEGEIGNHLDYPRTIRTYAELFGTGNLCVATFEQLIDDPGVFWGRICDFMGIDRAEALQLIADSDDNTRWTVEQLRRLQAIKASPLQSLRFRFAERARRKSMLDLARDSTPRTPGERAQVRLSPARRAEVVERTREGNRWLDDTFGLDLSGRGYLQA